MRLSLVSMPTPRSAPAKSGFRAGSHPHQSTTTMRRHTLPLLVGAVAALAVACRDSMAPARSTNEFSASASPSFSRSNSDRDRQVIGTLALSPAGGRYHVGDFDIVIPAGAVCDPATTKYGARHWDEDCSPAQSSIVVNVIAKKHHNQVSIDFQPDIRFRPSAGWVRIETSAYSSLLTSGAVRQLSLNSPFFSNFAILYVPTGGLSRIDEVRATQDWSMVTHVDLRSGLVWRRVKHFSGYMVSLGDKCTTTTDPTTTCTVDATAASTTTLGSFTAVPTVAVDTTATVTVDTTAAPVDTTTPPPPPP